MYFENHPTSDQRVNADKLSRVKLWDSRFSFLNAHYGIRPSRIHYLIGTTGTGKSSVLEAIIGDSSIEHPTAVISTETDAMRYIPAIEEARRDSSKNVNFVFEKTINPEITINPERYLGWIEDMIVDSGVKAVFLDNLTTSCLYSGNFASQQNASKRLTTLAGKLDIALFVIAHTKAEVTDNMNRPINGEDIRGPKTPFIEADFFYVFQRWVIGKNFFPVMTTVKHRGYKTLDKLHMLNFQNGIYTGDKKVEFEDVNRIFCQRNQLGRKQF